ncbi:MAG: hypothetical protein IJ088_08950, partial [Clostridia bacterium]|nr:hypothetical protein [Clostridia bacterium]
GIQLLFFLENTNNPHTRAGVRIPVYPSSCMRDKKGIHQFALARDSGKDFVKPGEKDLGFFMRVLKHQKEGAAKILYDPKYEQVEPESANAANDIAKLGLKIVVEKGVANMCRSMKEHDQETRILELIDYLKDEGKTKEEIINKILKRFPVTAEYVESLMVA